jgi:hypothetical protein
MGVDRRRLLLIVMYSAYRRAVAQRIPEGNIFVRIVQQGSGG